MEKLSLKEIARRSGIGHTSIKRYLDRGILLEGRDYVQEGGKVLYLYPIAAESAEAYRKTHYQNKRAKAKQPKPKKPKLKEIKKADEQIPDIPLPDPTPTPTPTPPTPPKKKFKDLATLEREYKQIMIRTKKLEYDRAKEKLIDKEAAYRDFGMMLRAIRDNFFSGIEFLAKSMEGMDEPARLVALKKEYDRFLQEMEQWAEAEKG